MQMEMQANSQYSIILVTAKSPIFSTVAPNFYQNMLESAFQLLRLCIALALALTINDLNWLYCLMLNEFCWPLCATAFHNSSSDCTLESYYRDMGQPDHQWLLFCICAFFFFICFEFNFTIGFGFMHGFNSNY